MTIQQILADMWTSYNTYWAKQAKEVLENEIERDILFTANLMIGGSKELRKRIRINHLI